MKNWLEKVCAALCLLGAVAAAPACGEKDSKQCEDGQTFATFGDVTDCFDACTAGTCGAGLRCVNSLCVPEPTGTNNNNPPGTNNSNNPPGTNNNNPPGTNNNTSTTNNNTSGTNNDTSGTNNDTTGTNNDTSGTNNDTTGTNNDTTNPTDEPTAETIALCEKYADLVYGSCLDSCTLTADEQTVLSDASISLLNGDGTAENPGCARLLTDDPTLRAEVSAAFGTATCADLGYLHCGRWGLSCGSCTPPTNLGATCADDSTCDGGSLEGYCAKETGASTGVCIAVECPSLTNAENGYLWQTDICGTNGVCQQVVPTDGSPEFGICIQGCTDSSECDSGVCQIGGWGLNDADDVVAVRVCANQCTANDCGADGRCNSAGQCEFECSDDLVEPTAPEFGTWEDVCTNSGGTCAADGYCVL